MLNCSTMQAPVKTSDTPTACRKASSPSTFE